MFTFARASSITAPPAECEFGEVPIDGSNTRLTLDFSPAPASGYAVMFSLTVVGVGPVFINHTGLSGQSSFNGVAAPVMTVPKLAEVQVTAVYRHIASSTIGAQRTFTYQCVA